MPMTKQQQRARRRRRIRKKILGTPDRPRLSVFRSNKNIYAQLVDDVNEITIAGTSSMDPRVRDEEVIGTDQARRVGEILAEDARAKGISKVVFDRGGYKYHGRVKALADAARDGGLKF